MVVIVACAVFITLAVYYQDDRVVGDYYKEGLLINERMDAVRLARDLGLSAQLRVDNVIGEISVRLVQKESSAQEKYAMPATLSLYLQHPSQQGRDQQLLLKRTSMDQYVADLTGPLESRWYVTLTPATAEASAWRMQSEIDLNTQGWVQLTP